MSDHKLHIMFYDVSSPTLYSLLSFGEGALRGTEGTLLRIAHGLSTQFNITIAQHKRKPNEKLLLDDVHYVDIDTAHQLEPDIVILLRDYKMIQKVAAYYPNAKRFFWMHNMPPKEMVKHCARWRELKFEIIAVSDFHRDTIIKKMHGKWYQRLFRAKKILPTVHRIYNPIPDDLEAHDTAYEKTQLLFLSAPYKGLEETLQSFNMLRRHFPEYRLLIANPSDQKIDVPLPDNVAYLGALSRDDLLSYLRTSFCVFYPQAKRVETFGLIYAEANAVGTPVLAHDFGAAREVLSDDDQLIDGRNVNDIIGKIKSWREKRPMVKANPNFKLSRVLAEWKMLLSNSLTT